jgi:hypothetical protein
VTTLERFFQGTSQPRHIRVTRPVHLPTPLHYSSDTGCPIVRKTTIARLRPFAIFRITRFRHPFAAKFDLPLPPKTTLPSNTTSSRLKHDFRFGNLGFCILYSWCIPANRFDLTLDEPSTSCCWKPHCDDAATSPPHTPVLPPSTTSTTASFKQFHSAPSNSRHIMVL